MKLLFATLCAGAVGLVAARKFITIRAAKAGIQQEKCIIYVASKSREILDSLCYSLVLPEEYSLSRFTNESTDFHVEDFLKRLHADLYGRVLYYGPRMPSTQTFLSQNIHSVPVGAVCVADVQYQGKGRAGNLWTSPRGCLMFSFTLQMENGRTVPFVQYVVCLAVVCGIESVSRAKNVPMTDVRIKWPNDLYSGTLKIGGVLCTSTYSSKIFHIVAGVGLNVANDVPTTCLNHLLSQMDPNATPFTREELLAAVLESFEELFNTFNTQGFTPLESLYYDKWMHSGQKVLIEENESRIPVVIEGLTSSGFLLATDEDSNKYELHPDGNSLDFFKGLVRKKLT